MKRQFNKVIGASVLAASLSILPLSISAQAQTNTGTDNNTGSSTTTTTTGTTNDGTYNRDNGFDWGWLGLLGLAGLAGLAGKKRAEEPTRYRDPNAVGGTGHRE
ncbi:hypothetical protein NIES4071_81320 [Calothrix sp. NIES-4071]|nr:hypothetical protein NIES4071_81320 [Calothrix sp. NIES-4071]BAZ62401.1 hypothetical protein NIES4105_81250 [Calothrix sp. NIES-4105]